MKNFTIARIVTIKSLINARNAILTKVNLTEKVIEKKNECVIVNMVAKTHKLFMLVLISGGKITPEKNEPRIDFGMQENCKRPHHGRKHNQ